MTKETREIYDDKDIEQAIKIGNASPLIPAIAKALASERAESEAKIAELVKMVDSYSVIAEKAVKTTQMLESRLEQAEKARKIFLEVIKDEIENESEKSDERGHLQSMHLGAMEALNSVKEAFDEALLKAKSLKPTGGEK
jgi:hypothetical protein